MYKPRIPQFAMNKLSLRQPAWILRTRGIVPADVLFRPRNL
jgi:hypothetical protein